MWLSSLIREALSLLHAKSVLLICDNKRQIGKIRFLLYERMSAYNKRIFLVFKALMVSLFCFAVMEPVRSTTGLSSPN